MSFSTLIQRNDYIGNGFITAYDYLFKIFSDMHLMVLQQDVAGNESQLQLYVHYTVQGVGRPTGGTVTLIGGALPAGYKLAIIRRLTYGQPTDLRNQGGYYPETVEDQLDKLAMTDMQLQEQIDHSIKVPMSMESSAVDPVLPNPVPNNAIGWNEDGTALVNIPVQATEGIFLKKDGSEPMTGPLTTPGITFTDLDTTAVPSWGTWEVHADGGVLHWHHNGSDKFTFSALGMFVVGRVFGNNGGIGLGRITASTGAPPTDGQEGDIHFQF
jgi:hypothetical protein